MVRQQLTSYRTVCLSPFDENIPQNDQWPKENARKKATIKQPFNDPQFKAIASSIAHISVELFLMPLFLNRADSSLLMQGHFWLLITLLLHLLDKWNYDGRWARPSKKSQDIQRSAVICEYVKMIRYHETVGNGESHCGSVTGGGWGGPLWKWKRQKQCCIWCRSAA